MSDEFPPPPAEESPGPSGNRPIAIVITVFAVLLALIVLGIWHGNKPSRAHEGSSFQDVVSGDIQLKLSYLMDSLGQPKESRKAIAKAEDFYEQAVQEAPVPRAFRRLGLLRSLKDQTGAIHTLERIDDPKTLKEFSPADRKLLKREVDYWKHVFSGEKISTSEAQSFMRLLGSVDLGPTKYIAFYKIHKAAGMTDAAKSDEKHARSRYSAQMMIVLVVVVVVGLMGLAGLLALFGGGVITLVKPDVWNRFLRLDNSYPEDAPLETTLWRSFLAYLVLFAAVSLVGREVLGLFTENASRARLLNITIFGQVIVSLVTGVLAIYVLSRLTMSEGWMDSVRLKSSDLLVDIGWGIAGYAVALPLLALGAVIGLTFSRLFPNIPTPPNQAVPMLLGSPSAFGLIAVMILATVFAPLFEEIFFRGALFRALRQRLGVLTAVLLSASSFALLHPLPAGFFPIFALGTVFALLVQARNSLVPSIVAHALNNGLMLVVLLLGARG